MTKETVDKLKRMMDEVGILESEWSQFIQHVDLSGSEPMQRFARDVFFAGAMSVWKIIMVELARASTGNAEAGEVLRGIRVEFARFSRERVSKLSKRADRQISIKDWP